MSIPQTNYWHSAAASAHTSSHIMHVHYLAQSIVDVHIHPYQANQPVYSDPMQRQSRTRARHHKHGSGAACTDYTILEHTLRKATAANRDGIMPAEATTLLQLAQPDSAEAVTLCTRRGLVMMHSQHTCAPERCSSRTCYITARSQNSPTTANVAAKPSALDVLLQDARHCRVLHSIAPHRPRAAHLR